MSDQTSGSRILLLTGAPGVGKTTLVRKAVAALSGLRLSGFVTEEIREQGSRTGFRIETFAGDTATLAHVDIRSRHRVGKYGVDVGVMDRIADVALNPAGPAELFLIDEIGKMECFSSRFVAMMRVLLDSDFRIVATIPIKGGKFVQEVRQHPDAELWEITRGNRDEMLTKVMGWIKRR